MGIRGADARSDWFEIADELSQGALGNKAGVIVMRADIELHQGEVQCAADRFVSESPTTWFRSPYLAGRAEAFARLGRKDADDAIAAAEEGIGEHRYGLGDPAPRQGNSRRRRGHPAANHSISSRRSTARTRRHVPAG